MYKYFILPYRMASKSSRVLARALNTKRIYPNRRYRGRPNHTIINWGFSNNIEVPTNRCREILNHPSLIDNVSNKLHFFSYDSTANKVGHTTSHQTAHDFIDEGRTVYCRTILQGHGGQGIIVADSHEKLVPSSLYTIAPLNIITEYRIHIFKNEIFHIQQKRKMSSEKLEEYQFTHNPYIKNYQNGYVFAINDIEEPSENTKTQAKEIIEEHHLDFGAVDIIEDEDGFGYILEVNTAPGLEGTTLEKYKETFENYLEQL